MANIHFVKNSKAKTSSKAISLQLATVFGLTVFGLTVFGLSVFSTSFQPAWAESTPLTQLEDHFFQHTYPNDTEDERLDRIEKLVFGEAKSGDGAARISELQKVVAEADSTPSVASNSSSGSSSAANNTSSSSAPDSSTSAADSAALAGTDYPRVDELEQLILNQNYKQLPLAKRLNQLETKLFGKPSSDDDLSARTDALEVHWEKTLSPSLERQYIGSVDWLENKVIGQNYGTKPLIERVQTLEGIVFPNQPPDTSSGIKEQIETLTNAVQISKNSAPGVTPMASTDQGQQAQHSYPGQPAQNQYTSQGQYPQSPPAYPSNTQGYGAAQTSSSAQAYNPPAYGQQQFQMPSSENLQPGQGYPQGQNYSQGQSYQQPQPYQQNQGYQQESYQTAQNYQQPQGIQQNQTSNQYSQAGQATENSSGAQQQQAQQQPQSNGHPLLKGLAKALGAAATMAAGAMSSGMMNMNYGNNGMYGNSMYSGGYNGYNTGYGGYGGYGSGTNIRF
ncbi:hypothetical protein BH11CYA1_BH11CYA1_21430 [soil metagenome]